MKQRAPRNKTIVIENDEEKKILLKELLFDSHNKKIFTLDEITNKIINADLFNIIEKLPQKFADLIIIDPPYNLTKNYNGLKFTERCIFDYIEYLRLWVPKICRLLKDDGSLYVCCDWSSSCAIRHVICENNLHVLNRITWQREKGRGAKNNWKNSMEDIWFAVKDKKKYFFNVEAVKQKRKVLAPYKINGQPKDWIQTSNGNFRLTYPSNFWDDISVPYCSMPENTDHPTQKPEKLIAKLILASSSENSFVFDPFLGSGTTSVVAQKLGRKYCGIEINEDYACIAQKRLQIAKNNIRIQGYEDGVFWERNSQTYK